MKLILKSLFFLSIFPALLSTYILFIYFSVEIDFEREKNKRESWVLIDRISPFAKWAIVLSEDWAFYDHKGLDYNQLGIVLAESFSSGTLTRGASTISQQVVKNLYFSNERSLIRKFKEVILTYKLEKTLTKDQILEIYLNIIEFGEDLYGVRDASYFYFDIPPSKLRIRESAFLAMLLPSPKKYSVSFRNKELTPFANEVVGNILIKMRQARVISEDQRVFALDERFWWESLEE